jgi:methyl-accepting chemotaxis protein
MDQGTQQNAAMVEESTAAVHSLSKEADAMAELMANFDIGETAGGSIRSQLQKTAPHAFRTAPKAAPVRTSGAKTPLAVTRGGRPAAKATNEASRTARRSATVNGDDGWEEF